jgi:high-affinity iron transporter
MTRLWIVSVLLFSRLSAAAEVSPRLLIHLLDYVALDYVGAVDDKGKVLSELEYGEMQEFTKTILESARSLDAQILGADTVAQLENLQGRVLAKAPPAEVAQIARAAQGQILARARIEVSPKRWPDLTEGAALFAKNCVQCHGAEGRGDGPSGAGLDPKPSNFHDGERMQDISPFQAYNAIRLGVPGTGMASWPDFSDQQAWALAFYVVSLRHGEAARVAGVGDNFAVTLEEAASLSDRKLRERLEEPEPLAGVRLAKLRLRSESASGGVAYLRIARDRLREAAAFAQKGDFDGASQAAIHAYLDGVEPVEPSLRAKDTAFVARIEQAMLSVRQAVSERMAYSTIEARVTAAEAVLEEAVHLLERQNVSPGFTFGVAFGIFLREGFEAILIIVTLLGVIRAVGSTRAAWFVHGGWGVAVLVGILLWFFSGWVVGMSTVSREIMEGAIALLAVVVLLYFGFWLHRKVQIERWRAFLESMTRTAMEGKKLLGLGIVAFMAVFREAFETILFLRALSLEPGTSQPALWGGVAASFLIILVLAIALVRFSVRIPIRQLFSLSSWIVWLLAFVLSGKAIHSFQESGWLPVSAFPVNLRAELVGLYPTWETVGAQAIVLLLGGVLFYLGSRPPKLKPQTA